MKPTTKLKLAWINLFARDFLLALILIFVNYHSHFKSWWAAFLVGAVVVQTSWHFSDFIKQKKLKEGLGCGTE